MNISRRPRVSQYLRLLDEVFIPENITFGGISNSKLTSLIKRDLKISESGSVLNSLFESVSIDSIRGRFTERTDISGSENIIFTKGSEYVYKLNIMRNKTQGNSLNDYIMSIMTQEYLWPTLKYDKFNYVSYLDEDCLFMRQKLILGNPTNSIKIKEYMINHGFTYFRDDFYAELTEGLILAVMDLGSSEGIYNCVIKNEEIYAFDARFKFISK